MNAKELDQILKKLALEVQRHPPLSKGRKQAFTKLWNVIFQNSYKLCRPYKGQFQNSYEEIYAQVLQKLCLYIWENIDKYDTSKGEFLQWCNNFLLMRRFFLEACQEIMPEYNRGLKRLSLDDLSKSDTNKVNSQLPPTLSEQVIQYIEEDPEGIFRSTYTSNNPAANFQTIALKLVKERCSWNTISADLGGLKISTLSSFYQRTLTKFAPKFRQYLSE